MSQKAIDAIYLHFLKAFDPVDYSLLLRWILLQGFDNTTIHWLASYLSNLSSIILKIHLVILLRFIPISGVLQGLLLAPYLFSLFINDLSDVIGNFAALMFTDDIKLFPIITTENDCFAI